MTSPTYVISPPLPLLIPFRPVSTPTPTPTLACRLNLKDLALDRVLGGGAFGQVWQGTWRGTPVAVKVSAQHHTTPHCAVLHLTAQSQFCPLFLMIQMATLLIPQSWSDVHHLYLHATASHLLCILSVTLSQVLSAACQSNLPAPLLKAFIDEVEMLSSLRHPNICLYMAACIDPPNRAIVTELVSRGSLWEVLRTPGLFEVRYSCAYDLLCSGSCCILLT